MWCIGETFARRVEKCRRCYALHASADNAITHRHRQDVTGFASASRGAVTSRDRVAHAYQRPVAHASSFTRAVYRLNGCGAFSSELALPARSGLRQNSGSATNRCRRGCCLTQLHKRRRRWHRFRREFCRPGVMHACTGLREVEHAIE